MFTETELKEKGGKRAVLEYLVQHDSSIPVPETVLESEISRGVILRSDHWREFDDFYGIFESVFIGREFQSPEYAGIGTFTDPKQAIDYISLRETGIPEVDKILETRRMYFREYCKAKGLDSLQVLSELRIFPQKTIESRLLGTMFLHPNVPGRYVAYIKNKSGQHGSLGIVYDDSEKIKQIRVRPFLWLNPSEIDFSTSKIKLENIEEVTALYKKVTSLKNFQDNFSYMIEFTIDPLFVLQVRRFRKLKDGSNLECSWKDETCVIKTDLSFGLTSKEGVLVPYSASGLAPNFQIKRPGWNDEIYEFNELHPEGFAYSTLACGYYDKTFLRNIRVAFAGGLGKYFNHGSLCNMAEIPIYLFDIYQHITSDSNRSSEGIFIPGNANLKVFSNGREGYVKLLSQ
jgi:hypothetical protein